jgi:hypothetical protein
MRTHLKLMAGSLLTALLLTACGGGGKGEAPVAPDVPDEALASSEGYTEWAKSLRPSDSADPLNMDRLETAPSSETAEPASLD